MKRRGTGFVAILFVTMTVLVAGGSVVADVPSPTDDAASASVTAADDAAVIASSPDTDAARDVVADLLRDHGLSDEQVQQRLAELSDEDVMQLSQHADQIQEGGAPPSYIWLLIGAALVVLILATIF